MDDEQRSILSSLAQGSNHPAARAVAAHLSNCKTKPLDVLNEVPGYGIEGVWKTRRVRLGRASWATEIAGEISSDKISGLVFAIEGQQPAYIQLSEKIRKGSRDAIAQLSSLNIPSEILSGDASQKVADVAHNIGVEKYSAEQLPNDKFNYMSQREKDGDHTLMVGDGINDAPALAAAHVSMAPATAADVGRHAADFIFTRSSLSAVPFAFQMARRTQTVIKQNFGLALTYNMIAVPLAFAGYVTPLFAAIAMSASSILVVANAMRLQSGVKKPISTGNKTKQSQSYQGERVPV
ncbi:MAG: HAD-IC family P-type ATPase, partial [Pseudomonadota bacterium]